MQFNLRFAKPLRATPFKYTCFCGKNCDQLIECPDCKLLGYCSQECLQFYKHQHQEDCKNHVDVLTTPGYTDCLYRDNCQDIPTEDLITLLSIMSARNASFHLRKCYDGKFKDISIRIGKILYNRGSTDLMLSVITKVEYKHDEDPHELDHVWWEIKSYEDRTLFMNLDNILQTPGCRFCGDLVAKVFKCGKCKTVKYCSKECQRKHWIRHKLICKSHLELEQIPGIDNVNNETSYDVLVQILEHLSVNNTSNRLDSINRTCYSGDKKSITKRIGAILFERGGRELLNRTMKWIKVKHRWDRIELERVWKDIGTRV